MLPIFMRPRTAPNEVGLQATADVWRQAAQLLRSGGQAGYAMVIERHVGDPTVTGVVIITTTPQAASSLLRLFGLSA